MWHKELYGDSIGRWLFSKKLSDVIINITTKFLAWKLEGDFVWSERDKFTVGDFEITYQRCDVNLGKIHLLLEVFVHNSNLSERVILLKRMASEVWSAGDISKIHQWYSKILLSEAWALSMTVLICDSSYWGNEYNLLWSYHSMNENW